MNGKWGRWKKWSLCSVTCGKGHMQRSRLCIYPDLGHEDIPCKSNVMETKACTLNECRGTYKERNITLFYNPFVNITQF